MLYKHPSGKPFLGVAMAFIVTGAAIFAFGLVAWTNNWLNASTITYMPSAKVIGGLVVMALGYVVLELELMRQK